jgi:hypothetical protein
MRIAMCNKKFELVVGGVNLKRSVGEVNLDMVAEV